ncbi:MAG: M1 family metallopeptidase [Candidatus Woesearchaeota archaeon]
MPRLYKYMPRDFRDIDVTPVHMDLEFDVYDKHTHVISRFKLKNKDKSLRILELDAKNLEIQEISCDFCAITYNYKKKLNKIIIRFKKQVPKYKEFTLKTVSVCRPSKYILEGLYYDITPKGCPPQMITQCEMWGFQRIVPCIDNMIAKCTYRTKITADNRYTHMLTNGDIVQPRKLLSNGRAEIIYDNAKTPMAPYLFFLGVGCYDEYKKEFEYPDGDRFMLKLLLPPGTDSDRAKKALDILYDGVMWVNLFTGPETYSQRDRKERILELTRKRDKLKSKKDNISKRELVSVRKLLKSLVKNLRLGYKYTGDIYREIGMSNTSFGGMENVGNTTITTNRIIPFKEMTDPAFEYMIRVKIHEFYHNINGSEVTGKDPFQLWLNEAVTVFIDEDYHVRLTGEDYVRLNRLHDIILPGGVFSKDSGATTMPIIPEGFSDPNELISSVTYVKSPEFVRMIETLMGKENFVKALNNFHSKFAHKNAASDDWIEAMEEVSGLSLKRMAKVWLNQTGYPKVHARTVYDNEEKRFKIYLRQSGFKKGMHWEFPFVAALVDQDGNDIRQKTTRITEVRQTIVFENVGRPAFLSLNRHLSFYGKVIYDQKSIPELMIQVKKDSDIINRYMAFYKLMDIEKMSLLRDPKKDVSKSIIDLYFTLLSDKNLTGLVGGMMLPVSESVEDERYAYRYKELYDVRKKILTAVARKYNKQILGLYKEYNKKRSSGTYLEKELKDIKLRQVKNICLGLLSNLDNTEVHRLIKRQLDSADNATDRVASFNYYLNSSVKDKLQVLDKYEDEAKKSPVSFETFLAVVARNDSDDALDIIKRVERSEEFDINQANNQRALYNVFARNKKKSLLTSEGRNFIKRILIRLAPLNEYSCINILDSFNELDHLEEKYQVPLVKLLLDVMKKVDKDQYPSVYNTTRRILKKSPKSVRAYQKKSGKRVRV